ncbi:MAG: NgoFVII family restriction endonuclease [Bacteroidales bacterium]|nr:NgoFVII family restriction endonuclease [Bacteroidales bacterium]MBR7034827.1 NgoFVII family restriction endonuclease [Bacteroidales bacterium]
MLYTNNLEETVLLQPAKTCNRLQIISGFTDCERISTHIINLIDGYKEGKYQKCKRIDMIVGMYRSISEKKHKKLQFLIGSTLKQPGIPKFNLYYIYQDKEVHSKVYTWFVNNTPTKAFVGSANYSIEAFKKRRECMTECDPKQTAKYFDLLKKDSIDCLEAKNIKFSQIKTIENDGFDPDNEDYDFYNAQTPIATCQISLLTTKGDVGYGSSINWGIRPNGTKRNPNQAYIPYNKQDRIKDFFPDRENETDKNCPVFRVITKSAGSFHMRMAQQGNKALHSAESNSILGVWIRSQLKVPSGSFITKNMLLNYGKTYVTFRKYSDGTYLLDF